MKNAFIISMLIVAMALVAMFPLAVICAIMWIWDINAYIIAVKIVATFFVLLVVYVLMNTKSIIQKIEDRYGEWRVNKGM